MIKLTYPKSGSTGITLDENYLIASVDSTGNIGGDVLEYSLNCDTLSEGRGIYGENHVDHWKVDADLVYNPLRLQITPSPTSLYPRRITLSYLWYGIRRNLQLKYGLLVPGTVRVMNYTAGVYWAMIVSQDPSNPYVMIEVCSGTSEPHFVQSFTRFERFQVQPSSWSYRYETLSSPNVWTDINFATELPSFAVLQTLYEKFKLEHRLTGTNYVGRNVYKVVYENPLDNPLDLLSCVNVLPSSDPFKLSMVEWKDWGTLAHEASQTAIANQANMIAFVRDLRHPTKLIPKLRNLRKLKSWANALLSVKYGVLPTITDLKSIVAAVRKRGPYLDKNGFSTYSKGHWSSFDGVYGLYTLEQHIKLAVAKEEDDLDRLVTSLESVGFWPDLNTLWDLVPYSFVIDWFVNVGELLARLDSRERLARLNIRYTTMSSKESLIQEMDEATTHVTGKTSLVHYHRWVSDQCPVPPLSLDSSPTPQRHWLEAGALILQRTK